MKMMEMLTKIHKVAKVMFKIIQICKTSSNNYLLLICKKMKVRL